MSEPTRQRGWPRAAVLLGVVVATPVVHPAVLLAVPLLLLLSADGLRKRGVVVIGVLAAVVVGAGARDGLWLAERAWALLLGGWFLGLSMLAPTWATSARALGAVTGAAAVGAGALAIRTDAWVALDATISDGLRAGFDATVDGWTLLSGGEPMSSELVTTFQQAWEAQIVVFPALILLESMAALGVAWWARTRLVGEGDQGLGALRDFRFNDHLVWVLVGGLLLVVLQFGEGLQRVGSNAVVFMGALYAMRGAGVFLFVSGGLSIFGLAMLLLGIVAVPAVVLGSAALIGVGDTWFDLRSRARRRAV